MRRFFVLLLVFALPLLGCSRSQPVSAPPTPTATAPVADAPSATPPSMVAAVAPERECQLLSMASLPRVEVTVQGSLVGVLMPESCTYTVAPGTSLHIVAAVPAGQEGKGATVNGSAKLTTKWSGTFLNVDGTLAADEMFNVILNDLAMYTFVARAPAGAVLTSSAGQTGPWSSIPATGFIPVEHRWLRLEFSQPVPDKGLANLFVMQQQPAAVRPDDRSALYDLASLPPVLELSVVRDANGQTVRRQPELRFLYHTPAPVLQLVVPEGSARNLVTFAGLPAYFEFAPKRGAALAAYYVNGREQWQAIDLNTGAVTTEGVTPERSGPKEPLTFLSPDGKRRAEVKLPGDPKAHGQRVDPADLIVTEGDRELTRQVGWLQVTREETMCTREQLGFAWRPDGGALAAISAAEPKQLQLKVLDLTTKESRILAEIPQMAPVMAFDTAVTWSPTGAYVSFRNLLLDAQTGRTIASDLSPDVQWSPDGRYLLVNTHNNFFQQWGKLTLVEGATGRHIDLGRGIALGWTPQNQAAIIRWDASEFVPPSAKGCP